MEDKSIKYYLKGLKHSLDLTLASLLITLIITFVGEWASCHYGHETAFNKSIELLYHYPSSLSAILAFSVTIFILLALALPFENSIGGDFLKFRAVIPAMRIASHMLCLAVGILFAWIVIYGIINNNISSGSIKGAIAAIFACSMVNFTLVVSADILSDKDNPYFTKYGKSRPFLSLAIAIFLIWAFRQDASLGFTKSLAPKQGANHSLNSDPIATH